MPLVRHRVYMTLGPTNTMVGLRILPLVLLVTGVGATAQALAADASTPVRPPAAPTKPAPKVLCDESWDFGFYTVAIDRVDWDGKAQVKDYDPQHPDVPWSALSEHYLGLRDSGWVFFRRFIGRFRDKKEAEELRTDLYRNSKYAGALNPRFPPSAYTLGALLVSNPYTCKLDKGNPVLRYADWVAEIDGLLYAAKEEACKGGKKKKTIKVVDCKGDKTLLTDTWTAPCEATRINACLYRMSPGIVGIQQEHSAAGEGREMSFRAYDTGKRRKVFGMTESYDRTGGPDDFTDVKDVDGDGVPELSDRHCDGDDCQPTRLRKWNGQRFVEVKNHE